MWVAIIAIVLGGAWWLSSSSMQQAQAPGNGSAAGTAAANDNSDAAIDQSMANIDAQLNGLSSDTVTVDQSMNDQPVQQQAL